MGERLMTKEEILSIVESVCIDMSAAYEENNRFKLLDAYEKLYTLRLKLADELSVLTTT